MTARANELEASAASRRLKHDKARPCADCHRRNARSQRTRCNSCRARLYDKPLGRAFRNLKAHAKARGVAFALTLSEFASVAVPAGYIEGRGVEAESLTIDRIDHRRGYEVGNIDVVTHAYNSMKGYFERERIPMGDAAELRVG